ncbi:MAG: hypothetical protein AAGU75_23165, partial [Bacillota bacterium]
MGVFSFLFPASKRPANPSSQKNRFNIDFISHCGVSLNDCTVSFESSVLGCFVLNGKDVFLGAGHVDDVGPSSDNLYLRADTPEYRFWVKPKDFSSFTNCLNIIRNRYLESLIESRNNITSFEDYLGSEQQNFTVPHDGNVLGVSHNYGNDTFKSIAKLSPGDTLSLVLCDYPFDNEHQIIVLTSDKKQIGWYPICSSVTYEEKELLSQLTSGVKVDLTVEETGTIKGNNGKM